MMSECHLLSKMSCCSDKLGKNRSKDGDHFETKIFVPFCQFVRPKITLLLDSLLVTSNLLGPHSLS